MVSQRFRLNSPMIAIVMENGLYTAKYTKAGDDVIVVCGPLDGVRLVEVKWKGPTVLVFMIELREHAELLSELRLPSVHVSRLHSISPSMSASTRDTLSNREWCWSSTGVSIPD